MEKTCYCVIAGVSILFLVGCLAHLGENDTFSLETIKKFRRLIAFLIFEVLIDCLFFLLESYKMSTLVLYSVKGGELILNPVLAFLVFDIFYEKKMNRRSEIMRQIRKVMLSVIIANGVLQIVAIFRGCVFYIDKDGIYQRGPLMHVYIALLFIAIFALMYGLYVFSSKTQSTMQATLLSFTAIVVVSIVLRNFFPDCNYDFLCLSVAIPFLLLYYSHVTLRVDPLTKLLNRQVYSRLIKKINYSTIIIEIDANDFKLINDTYGHECGDQTLKRIAHAIYKAYGKYAYCFRIGGDEFCVILKPDAFEKLIAETPHCDVYSMAESFMKRLEETLLTQAESENEYGFLKFGVSQGYGIFYSETSYPSDKERMPLDKVIKLADERMYRNKEQFKKEHPEPKEAPIQEVGRARVVYEPAIPELVKDDENL